MTAKKNSSERTAQNMLIYVYNERISLTQKYKITLDFFIVIFCSPCEMLTQLGVKRNNGVHPTWRLNGQPIQPRHVSYFITNMFNQKKRIENGILEKDSERLVWNIKIQRCLPIHFCSSSTKSPFYWIKTKNKTWKFDMFDQEKGIYNRLFVKAWMKWQKKKKTSES